MSIQSFIYDFKKMPRNVKVSVFVLPLWAIPFNLINSYASLYMLNQGISATRVGFINSVSFILKTFFALFAGHIINKYGRRRTVGVLDFFGWAVPMLLYFMAKSYWQFLLAAMINCITVINGIASQCLLIEDVESEVRIKAFNFSSITSAICGLFVPLTGLFISRFGFIPAIRYLYLFAFISMGTVAVCKLIFYRETSVGMEMMRQHSQMKNPVKNLLIPIRYVLSNHRLIFLFSLNILINFAVNINNLYFFPFLTASLGFSNAFISLFPFITTTVSLFVYFFIISTIRHMEKGAFFSIGMYTLGALILIASYLIDSRLALLCVACWAIAGAILNPVLNTMIANTLDDDMRTNVFGVFNVFSMLCMFPAGYFGGWLYEGSPFYPILFIFAVYLAGFLIFLFQMKGSSRKADKVKKILYK